jgi:4-cresol dehydrogenase (hydroxylating)
MRLLNRDNINFALSAWQESLGNEHVVIPEGEKVADVAEFRSRKIPAILRPGNVQEIQKVVEIANQYGVPLHTVSTGKNWGLGSRIPVQDSVLVELKRMNKIIEVNEKFRYAVVEPGVTQGQLAAYLQDEGSALIPNIGGAGLSASVVANVLERGSGVFGCKVDACLALEVVLANGKVIRTGLWNYFQEADSFIHCFPVGLGPDVRGLFIQSNFGIVTQAVLRLHPRGHHSMVAIGVRADMLSELVDAAHELRKTNLLMKGIDIANALTETDYYPNPDNERINDHKVLGGELAWTLLGCLPGPGKVTTAAQEEIKAYFQSKHQFSLYFFSTDDQPLEQQPAWVQEWTKRYTGVVDNSHLDVFLRKGSNNYDLDNNPDAKGFLVLNFVVPCDGQIAAHFIKVVEEVSNELGISQYIKSFSDLGEGALKGHLSLLFNRDDKQSVALSHRWKDTLFQRLRGIGIYPQRLDVDSMQTFTQPTQGSYWETLQQMKTTLDPNGILSPGRYLAE